MDKIRFKAQEDVIYDATMRTISEHVMGLMFGQKLVKDLYTSGFDLINEYNGSVMASYEDYTTEYRIMDDGEIQLSNDGSIYIPPEPPAPVIMEVHASVTWEDKDDEDKIRPASVNATLYVDGTKKSTKKLSKSNNWEHTFEVNENDNYNVEFDDVEGYTKNGSPMVTYYHEALSSIRKEKVKELKNNCTTVIYDGAKVNISATDETIHFNFTKCVQNNITVAYNMAKELIGAGKEAILVPFYDIHNAWSEFTPADIIKIYVTMYKTIMENVGLVHQLTNQIYKMTSAEDIKKMEYKKDSLDNDHKDKYDTICAEIKVVIEGLLS